MPCTDCRSCPGCPSQLGDLPGDVLDLAETAAARTLAAGGKQLLADPEVQAILQDQIDRAVMRIVPYAIAGMAAIGLAIYATRR